MIHAEAVEEMLHKKAEQLKLPVSGTFELSPLCNLNCRMCYVRKEKRQLKGCPLRSAEDWIKLAKEARDAGMLFLLLTGGEPFFYQDFSRLYQELSHMGFVISINSNGTLIGSQEVEFLKESPPKCINVTLYGSCESTYEKLCGDSKGFHKAMNGLEMLKNAGIPTRINVSITPDNWEETEEIFQIGKSLSIPVRAASYMFPPVRKETVSTGRKVRLSPEEAAAALYQTERITMSAAAMEKKAEIVRTIKEEKEKQFHENKKPPMSCRAGLSSFWITWDGQMTPCGMLEKPSKPVFETGFEEAWKYISEEREHIVTSVTCAACPMHKICPSCAASGFAETGRTDGTPDYLCRMMESYCQLYCESSGQQNN